MDRWLASTQAWRLAPRAGSAGSPTGSAATGPPLVVDLGYGASPITAVELRGRLAAVRPDVHVVALEIDPRRVAAGRPYESDGLTFRLGGFEVPLPDGRRADVIRAANVLRQYDEDEVPAAWERLRSRLSPTGIVVDGTCDEIGRRSTWVTLEAAGPVSLTLSLRFGAFERPSDVAERLPKALIHRNVPGERVHDYLQAADAAWLRNAPLASYGSRQRFVAMCADLRACGWPLLDRPARWRLGEVTVAWQAVQPRP